MRHTTQEGIDLIKHYEGFSPTRYHCPAGIRTIGYGHTGVGVRENRISEEYAERLLRADLRSAERSVLRLINVPLTDGAFNALVSFTFNLGGGALQRSALRAKLNRGEYEDAANEFPKWVFAGGVKLRGLEARRKDERLMFLS